MITGVWTLDHEVYVQYDWSYLIVFGGEESRLVQHVPVDAWEWIPEEPK